MPTVLIADDSLSVRKVAERLLTEAGLEVALAANAEEAINWLSSNRPDIVLADVIMPDKSGFDVCSFVRGHASISGTPVLLVTGFVDDEVTRQAEACGANGVVKKPFQGAMLREKVMELLNAQKTQPAPVPEPSFAPAIEMPALTLEPVVAAPAIEKVAVSVQPVAVPIPATPPAKPAVPSVEPARPVQMEPALTEAIRALESRLTQVQAAQEQAAQTIKSLEARLAEAETRSAQFYNRLAELEPTVAAAQKLIQVLAEFARTLNAGKG